MTTPNLFKFATSELSQDAFICWLLSWAKKDYEIQELRGKLFKLNCKDIGIKIKEE